MKKWIITTVVIGTVSVALTALAMPHGGEGQGEKRGEHGGRGGGPEGGRGIGLLLHHPDIAEKAGVTDEQIEEIKELAYENRRAQIPLQSELSLAKMDLEHAVSQDEPDVDAIDAAIENVGRIETELAKLQVRQRLGVREILGTDTLEKIQEIARKKMRAKMKEENGQKGEGQHRFSKRDGKRHGGTRGKLAPTAPDSEEVAVD